MLVLVRDKPLETHSPPPRPRRIHVGEEGGEVRGFPLTRLADATHTHEDVCRGALGKADQSLVEDVEPAGDDSVQLDAAVGRRLAAEPFAQALGGLEGGFQAIEVLDLGERREPPVVVPEIRMSHRSESGLLTSRDAGRVRRRAHATELVEEKARVAGVAPRRERQRAQIELRFDGEIGFASRLLRRVVRIRVDEGHLYPLPPG